MRDIHDKALRLEVGDCRDGDDCMIRASLTAVIISPSIQSHDQFVITLELAEAKGLEKSKEESWNRNLGDGRHPAARDPPIPMPRSSKIYDRTH